MQSLPPLGTAEHPLVVPLADCTASRLAAALVEADDVVCDAGLLLDALARDPALALWAAARAAQRGQLAIANLEGLSRWLAGALLDELACPHVCRATQVPRASAPGSGRPLLAAERSAVEPGTREAWADFVGQSLATARLAGEIARHAKLDAEKSYFLGLFAPAAGLLATLGFSSDAAGCVLPQQNDDQPNATAGAGAGVSSPAAAVRVARRMLLSGEVSAEEAAGVAFDDTAHRAQIAAARQEWLARGPAPALAALASKLHQLRTLQKEFQRTLEKEKLDSLKELAYGAGHEINNPLANISARAQTLLRQDQDPERRRLLATIHTQALRAHEMIADMMLFARPPQPRPEVFDLVQTAREIVGELQAQAAAQQVELTLPKCPASLEVRADRTQIAVAIRAVCVNALEACSGGGRIEIELSAPSAVRKSVQITISDSGPGIPEAVRPHVFDPFFSGREAGRGLGFGLSKCWRIVTMHGGQVTLGSSRAGGACFTISLPEVGEAM